MSRGRLWIAALAPQVALLVGMVAVEEHGRATGAEVVLEVRAYDPMEPVAGRYISVPLAISRLDLTKIPHPEPIPSYGSRVYVRVTKGETTWQAAQVAAELPESPGGLEGLFLRARVESPWNPEVSKELRLAYDIDRFYISEDAEDPSVWRMNDTGRRRLAVVARVTASGRAHTVDLLVDGRPYQEWNREQRRRSAGK